MKRFTTKITAIALSAMLFFGTAAPINAFAEEVIPETQTETLLTEEPQTEEPLTEEPQTEEPKEEEPKEEEPKGEAPVKKTTTKKKVVKKVKTYKGTVLKKLPIRKRKSKHSKRIKTYKKGAKITLLTVGSKWVKVKVGKKVGYAWADWIKYLYGTARHPYKNVVKGKVTCKKLAIRTGKSEKSRILKVLKKGTTLKVLTPGHTWVKVQYGKIIGYTKGKHVNVGSGAGAVKASSDWAVYAGASGGSGAAVAAMGLRYVGGRYVWGGSTLGRGVDCSGFIMALYRRFGRSLPHSSSAMRHCGRSVGGLGNARPGDIVCYGGHVALYIGGGKVVHASNPSSGIKVSRANYRSIITIRRIF